MTACAEPALQLDNLTKEILDSAGVCIFWKDVHSRLVNFNQAYQEFMSRPREELIGRTIEELGAVNEAHPPLIDDAEILAGKTIRQVTGRLLDVNNHLRDVVVSKSPLVVDNKIVGIVGTIEDVTESREKANTLIQLKEAVQNVPSGILVYQWNEPEGRRLMMANSVAKQLFNIPEDSREDLDALMVRALHPDDAWCPEYLASELQKGQDEVCCNCRFYPIGAKDYIWLMIRVRTVPKPSGNTLVYISLTDITSAQKTAQALAESQHAYTEIATGANLIVWQYDMADNSIEFFNDKLIKKGSLPCRLPHRVQDGPGFLEAFVHPDSIGDFRQLHENLRRGKAGSCDVRFLTEPGQPPYWSRLTYTLPTGEQHSSCAYGIAMDITTEKLRAEQYDIEIRMLHTAVKANILSKSHFDLTENRLLDYIRHSPNALNLKSNASYEEFYELLLDMIISYEDRKLISQKLDRDNLLRMCSLENRDFSVEYKRHCDDLSPIMVECTVSLFTSKAGHIECFICFYDITNKFINYIIADKLSELGYDCMALINNLTGTMTYYSKKTGVVENTPEKPLFYDDALLDMLHEYIEDSHVAEDLFRQACLDAIVDFLDCHGPKDMYDFSFNIRNPATGQEGRKRLQACYLDSSHTSVFIIQSDITKQYQEERLQLRRLEDALSIADKASASKSLFLAGISHDMRTPLNGILSFTDFALKTESNTQRKYYLTKIRQSGELLLSLINDTLNLTRIESGKITLNPEWVDSKALVDGVIAGISMSANDRQLALNIHRGTSLPRYIIADKIKLQEILLNIISNSIKFTKPGGSVDIDLDVIPPQKQSPEELAAVRSVHHKWLRIVISDTGIGISQQFIPHLFEAFCQEESSEVANPNGTGLGLSIVKKYMDMMGGTIQVRSKLHCGTTFELHLMVEETQAMPAQKVQPVEKCHFSHLHILLVEDNVLNQEIANMLLLSKGASVQTASNGKEAVDMFEISTPGSYQLILMDLRMPVMNGYEATKLIRHSQHPDGAKIPIIAMTADAYDEDIKHCLAVGMNGHVSKPIRPDKLYAEISKWCSGI